MANYDFFSIMNLQITKKNLFTLLKNLLKLLLSSHTALLSPSAVITQPSSWAFASTMRSRLSLNRRRVT